MDLFSALAPPAQPRMPAEPIVRTATIEGPYRWTMTRAWSKGKTILWVLFNPSTADGKIDDPTTLRMMGFSYRWGFGSMIVANVYPFIASKPSDLHVWRRTFDHETFEGLGMPQWELNIDRSSWAAFHHNQRLISDILTKAADGGGENEEMTCVAAWGHGPTPADLEHFLHGIQMTVDDDEFGQIRLDPTWHCLGKNLDGSPVHPLARGTHRIADDAKLKIWKRRGDVIPGTI
jgi:Protein of unknown function (DUF1643)